MSIFHERLKILKETSGKTQAEIAAALEITPQTLSYYFNNREPSYDILIKLAQYFSVSTDYLLGVSEFKNNEEVKKINSENVSLVKFSIDLNPNYKKSIFELINFIDSDNLSSDQKNKILDNLSTIINLYASALNGLLALKEQLDINDPNILIQMQRILYWEYSTDSLYFRKKLVKATLLDSITNINSELNTMGDFLYMSEKENPSPLNTTEYRG